MADLTAGPETDPHFDGHGDRATALGRPPRSLVLLRKAWQLRMGVLGMILLLMLLAMALFSPYIATHDPYEQNIIQRLELPSFLGGSSEYLLGTDQLGRDLYSRIVYGARVSLLIGVASVVFSAVVGTIFGLLAGFFGGWIDSVVDFAVNAMLAFPFILLAMTLVIILGASTENIILALGISNWPIFARVTRIETRKLREQEYVLAALAQGLGHLRVIFKHICRFGSKAASHEFSSPAAAFGQKRTFLSTNIRKIS